MASEKTVKFILAAAMVAVVLGVAGYVLVFWHNYSDARKKTAPVMAAAPRSETVRKSPTRAAK